MRLHRFARGEVHRPGGGLRISPHAASGASIDNAVHSGDHATLVAAVKAAGLVDTLKGPGPFTVFAPTNAAFAALPAGTVDTLLKPESKPMLTFMMRGNAPEHGRLPH